MSRGKRAPRCVVIAAGAAVMGLAGVAAQGDSVVNRFDTAAEANQWRYDFGINPTISFDPTTDAGGGAPNSGSLEVQVNFDQSLGGNNKVAITRDLGSAAGIDGTQYSGMSMDILVDPNSAKDAFGLNGYGSLVLRNGPGWDWTPQFNDNMSSAAGWRHISVSPLQGTVNALHAITFQLYGGPSQNITGPVTFWIDNVVFNQKIPGDTNLDGSVNFTDLLTLAQHYGLGPNAMWSDGDFNNDGSVGFDDLLTLAQHYGDTAMSGAQVAAVPEPTSAMLIPLAGLAALRRCR